MARQREGWTEPEWVADAGFGRGCFPIFKIMIDGFFPPLLFFVLSAVAVHVQEMMCLSRERVVVRVARAGVGLRCPVRLEHEQ